jgi:Carboxypeptidase regulatory-like domain
MDRTKPVFPAIVVGALCLLLMPALASAATIEGTVTDASTTEPVNGVNVCAYGPTESCAATGVNGEYSLPGLETGSYKVEFNAIAGGLNYVTEYYNNKSTFEKAEPVNVLGESVASGIDAALAEGGQITGTVTDEATSEPIDGVSVCGFRIGEDIISCDSTSATGAYTVIGLPTNSYKVEFNGEPEYELEYYNNKSSPIKANSVGVVAGATTSGINAALAP